MREIKFRAWLLKETKMVAVDTLSNNKGYGGALEIIIDNPEFDPTKKFWKGDNRPCDSYLNHSLSIHKECNNGDDFILMQYTGFKDKNGIEIYEGDIVDDGFMIYEVKYMKFLRNVGNNQLRVIEVIGNIYEHAHLLHSARNGE